MQLFQQFGRSRGLRAATSTSLRRRQDLLRAERRGGVRAETRARVLLVIESGSERHRKVRRVLMTPSSMLHEFLQTSYRPRNHSAEKTTRETTPEEEFLRVWTHFSTSSCEVFAHALCAVFPARNTRAQQHENNTHLIYVNIIASSLPGRSSRAATFQRTHPSLYF